MNIKIERMLKSSRSHQSIGLSRFRTPAALLLAVLTLGAALAPAALDAAAGGSPAPAASAGTAGEGLQEPRSWLLKWRNPGLAKPLPGTAVLRRQPEAAVDVVAPAAGGADTAAWLRRLRATPGVEYVHPNEPVRVLAAAADAGSGREAGAAAASAAPGGTGRAPADAGAAAVPNDPAFPQQRYLEGIGAPAAWRVVREQTDLTIAVVDTGADLEHPDLKPNLVPGVNVIDPGMAPEDDNGHGTSVAGIIAAAGNNGVGVSGMLWKAKLMPVKALDRNGYGDESSLGEGIMQAVKKGARIIVLSVGLYASSPYMRDIAQYAESSGVLLVAATGNDGLRYGTKAAVEYPAAYPTVLAVGGTAQNLKPDPRSNKGTEIDLSAPWDVYTTAMGGGYHREEGTSMAAPQAAAAAALVWAKNKDMKPYQVRSLLRQTAKDIGPEGFDAASGYGLLQIGRALSEAYRKDPHEPAESAPAAAALPLGKTLSATIGGERDRDWYAINAPYDGTVTVRLQKLASPNSAAPAVRLTTVDGSDHTATHTLNRTEETIQWSVKKGINRIGLQMAGNGNAAELPYLLTPLFRMNADPYEPNDRQGQAVSLQPKNGTVTGTFHKTGDRDWYAVRLGADAALKLTLSSDTMRMDPALAVQAEGGELTEYDENSQGETERTPLIHVPAGTFYIRVRDASFAAASPVSGRYTLSLTVVPDAEKDTAGYQDTAGHWAEDEIAGMTSKGWLKGTGNARFEPDRAITRAEAAAALEKAVTNTSGGFARFKDVPNGYWAYRAIGRAGAAGWVRGLPDGTFVPGRPLTRAEMAVMVNAALRPQDTGSAAPPFRDVPSAHWAAPALAALQRQGWIRGETEGLDFAPGRSATRAEFAALLYRALN